MVAKQQLPTFAPVQGASLTDQVWRQLRSMILHDQMPAGTRLVELDIAAQMGVSQGSVREALQRLEQDGLVERRARTGTFVTDVSVDEMHEIFAVRSLVEQFAIRRTVGRISPAQLDELASLIDAMREAGRAGDMIRLVDHDLLFHRCIVQWSDHPMLLRVWLPLYTQVQRFIVRTHPHYFQDLVEIADTHQPILDALRGGVPDVAAERIEEHVMLIWSRIAASRQDSRQRTPPELITAPR